MPLPSDLADALGRARAVEDAAVGREQWLAAVAATSTLLAAAAFEGWSLRDLAEAAGLEVKATAKRIRTARHRPHPSGLDLTPPPPTHAPPPLPVEQREWLTADQAAELVGVARRSISQWYRAGFLPSTQRRSRSRLLYSRSDLERVVAAPRHANGGVSWPAARSAVENA